MLKRERGWQIQPLAAQFVKALEARWAMPGKARAATIVSSHLASMHEPDLLLALHVWRWPRVGLPSHHILGRGKERKHGTWVVAAGKWLDLVDLKEEAKGSLYDTDDTAFLPSPTPFPLR